MNRITALAAGMALSAALLLNAGCMTRSTAERVASFAPYAGQKLDDVAVEDFLSSRSAVLIAGKQLSVTQAVAGGEDFRVTGFDDDTGCGCATAIDRRGYFLTAAHNLAGESVFLITGSSTNTRVERATVVWKGNPKEKEPDLAILYAPTPPANVFTWARQPRTRDHVVATGIGLAHTNHSPAEFFNARTLTFVKPDGTAAGRCLVHTDFFAGRIRSFSRRTTHPPSLTIIHDAPGTFGDSGGPVVAMDGGLIGVNLHGSLEIRLILVVPFFHRNTSALQPDLDWLRQVIEKDAAARATTAPSAAETR